MLFKLVSVNLLSVDSNEVVPTIRGEVFSATFWPAFFSDSTVSNTAVSSTVVSFNAISTTAVSSNAVSTTTFSSAVELVWKSFEDMEGGEIYIKKIPSMKLVDIALSIAPKAKFEIIGIRPGEKIHEQMIGIEDAPQTYSYDGYFKILPMIHKWHLDPKRVKNGKKVHENFIYNSENNKNWMTRKQLQNWMKKTYG